MQEVAYHSRGVHWLIDSFIFAAEVMHFLLLPFKAAAHVKRDFESWTSSLMTDISSKLLIFQKKIILSEMSERSLGSHYLNRNSFIDS